MKTIETITRKIAYLGLGSNLGDREANLQNSILALVGNGVQLSEKSSIYETDPVDYLDQPKFLNQVIAVASPLEPFALLKLCLKIETELGRVRTIPRGARIIDIDLLLFDDQIINEESEGISLIVPHPRMHLRRFVLQPLAEIAPQTNHSVLAQTISQLLAAVDDSSRVDIFR
ncbi:MAG: 2-amino-4-hydroxy-6-hydroxymethyldihydropteridine diphosphokinase [Blastocatellia bacterium]